VGPAGSMKCGPDGNFTNLFLADGKYQNLSLASVHCNKFAGSLAGWGREGERSGQTAGAGGGTRRWRRAAARGFGRGGRHGREKEE
jgi:hypothetical protein